MIQSLIGSPCRYDLPCGQRFGKGGAGPVGALSSVGRASRLHREGQRFEPVSAHQDQDLAVHPIASFEYAFCAYEKDQLQIGFWRCLAGIGIVVQPRARDAKCFAFHCAKGSTANFAEIQRPTRYGKRNAPAGLQTIRPFDDRGSAQSQL